MKPGIRYIATLTLLLTVGAVQPAVGDQDNECRSTPAGTELARVELARKDPPGDPKPNEPKRPKPKREEPSFPTA